MIKKETITIGNREELKTYFSSLLEKYDKNRKDFEVGKLYEFVDSNKYGNQIDETYNSGQHFGIYFYLEGQKESVEMKGWYFYDTDSRPLTPKEFKNYKKNCDKLRKLIKHN